MRLTKRLLAMLLTVVMVLSMLPAIALTASAATQTIASWGCQSYSANTTYNASGGDTNNSGTATMSSTKPFNTSATNAYYGSSSGGAVITLGNLNTSGYTGTLTLTFYSRASKGGNFSAVCTGPNITTTTVTSGTLATKNTPVQYSITGIPADTTQIVMTHSASSGSLYFGTVALTGEPGTSKTLSSIALSGSYPTTFTQNGTFSHTGMVVTATYSDNSTADVTSSASFSGYNMTTTGNQTVTVSYTEGGTTKTATYSITVNPRAQYTLTYSANGSTTTSQEYGGDSITLPSTPSTTPSGYTFVGWLPNTYATNDTEPSGLIAPGGSYTMPASASTLYAVYAIAGEGGSSDNYELVSSITNGKYVVGAVIATTNGTDDDIAAMSSTVTSGWLKTSTMTPSNGIVTNTDSNYVWDVTVSGSTLVLQNESTSNYLSLSTSTGSGSANVSSTSATVYYVQTDSSGNTFKLGNSGITATSGNQLGYNPNNGSGGYRMYAVKTSPTTTCYYQMRFYKQQAGTSYSGYTTSPKTLSSITISGQTTTFTQGDEFAFGGTVTAHYSDSSTANVTANATFSGYNMNNTGSQTVTVTYVEGGVTKTATYNITVNPATTYDITLTQTTGGTISSSSTLTDLSSGATASISYTPAEGYHFVSWSVTGATYTGSNPITVTVGSSPVTVSANFAKTNYTITYENTYTEGTIGVAKRSTQTVTAQMGDTVDVTVTANNGYVVGDSITVTDTTNNMAVSTTKSGNVFTFTMPAGNVTVASNANTFAVNPTYTATFIADGTEMTTLADSGHNGDSITLPTVAQMTTLGKNTINYFDGTSNTTYTFAGWAPVGAISTPTSTQPSDYIAAGSSYTFGSASVTFRAVYVNGTAGFALSYTNSGTTYYAGTKGSGDYLTAESSASDAAVFGMEQYNNSDYYYLYYTVSGEKYYLTGSGSGTTLMISNANTVPTSGYFLWKETESSGSANYRSYDTSGTAGRYLAFNTSTKDRFASYTSAYSMTKAGGGAQYLTEHLDAGNACTVTFYDTDGTTELQTGTFYEGQTPSFTGTEPTKANSGLHYYTFAGWNTTANQSAAIALTAIGSSESTRNYYPVFTEHTATFTLSFTGRTKVSTEGSFQSTVLTPILTSDPEGFEAAVTGLTVTGGSNDSIATVSTTGNVLTVTGVSAGSLTLNVTAAYAGGTATGTVTVTVISGSGGAAGGYKLITQENVGSDVSDYDWTGEYIMVARPNGLASNFNTLEVMQFVWSDDTTATIYDGSANHAEFDLADATQDDFGVASATSGGVTMTALHTGESDYVDGATTTEGGMIYDRITGFTSGGNDVTNQYILVFECVDDVNNYYTIRVKGTNYYLTNSSTATSSGNTMGGNASPTSIGSQLMWHLRWAGAGDSIDGRASNTITLNGESFTPDIILIESVEALNVGVSRAILYNQAGSMFRVYGEVAYGNNGPLIGTNGGYNIFLYGKNNPFEAEINYDGTPRNTTTDKIEVPWNYATQAGNSSLLLEGALDPESYPGWTILNSGIPTWSLVGAYNPNGTTFSSSTSISAIAGTENANFNVANWTASDVGKYYVVRINYQVQDPDGVTHDVPQQAMIVVTESNNVYTTIIHEAGSQSSTGSLTYPSRIGSTGVDLDAYVRDNYSTVYTDREEVNGMIASQPTVWTYTSQKGYTYTISAAGVVTWDPAVVVQDDVVEIKATAGLTGGGLTATVAEGSITLNIRQLAYSGEVVATPDDTVTEIPYGATAFGVTLGNFKNNNNDAPGSSTYSINAASEWRWTASTMDGQAVSITGNASGATLDVTGLATGTQVIVRATNVIATSNIVANTHTVVTITGKIFTIGEDNSLAAVNDSFVLDFDRSAVLNVMANDRNADGATITAIGGTNASMAAIGTGANAGKITFTVPGGQLTNTYTFTYTLSKSGETSEATVTVKPATAIYYEDNNSIFTYADGTQGKWTDEGTASDWMQDADASTIGYDANINTLTYSLGRVKKANVGNATTYGTAGSTNKWPTMTFTFVGNAFEIDTFRDMDAGMFRVTVDGTKYNVSTAYGASRENEEADGHTAGFGWTYGVAGNYYGMPVFVWGDPSSTAAASSHTVTVQVLYAASFDYASPKANNYDVMIDGVKIYNPNVGGTTYKYISFRDTVLAAGTLGVPTTSAHSYIATLTPTNLSVGVGYTGQLSVSLTDDGQPVSSTGYSVSYASDDTNIARVDASSGLVTGVNEGTATITATITPNGGAAITKTCVVNVTNTVFTVTYKLPNGDQEVTYATEQITLGSGVTHLTAAELAEYNAHPYVFRGWVPATVADTATQPGGLLDDGMTLTIDGDRTYYALYTYGTTTDDFRLKTDLTTPLVDGETIVIYETEGSPSNYLLSNQDYSSTWNNFRLGVAAAPADGFVKTNNTNLYWAVEATSGGFYLKDQNGNYLTANATDGQLVMTTTPDEKAVWNATTTGVTGANSVFIYNSESPAKYLQHFSGYAEFGAYTFDEAYSNKNEMQIYVQQPNNLTYTTDLQSTTVRYTVNYWVNGTAMTSEQIAEGNNPSFPTVTGAYNELAGYSHDYTFLGWIPSTIAEDTTTAPATIYNSGDTYAVNDVTAFYAVFTYTGAGSAATGYSLSDSAPEAGDTFIIAANVDGTYYALNHSRSTTALTITNGAVADTTDVLWYLVSGNNGDYLKKDGDGTAASGSVFKLNSGSTNYNGISDATGTGNTGAMTFAASGDGFDMYGTYNTGRHLALSDSGASVASSAQTLYIFKYSTTGGSQSYYATTLGEAAPITHNYQASITPASLALHPGETGSVSATLTDNGTAVAGATPTYTTSLSSVATVAADGTVTAVANGNATITATFTVGGTDYTATCDVAVTTLATYNVTYMVNGSQYGEVESVTQGNSPSFTAPTSYDVSSYNAHNYEFLGWKEGSALSADTTETQTLYVAGNTREISGNTTYYAVYRYTEGGGALTEAIDLSNGASGQYVIAANVGGTYYAMHNSSFSGKLDRTQIATPGSSISSSDATNYVVTIAKTSDGFTISNGTNLLGYPSSGTDFTTDTHPYWSITTGTHGSYRVANTNTTNRAITYRAGSTNKFAPYATSNINGTEYYDVEIIPVGDSSSATYYATTLNVAAAHNYVASISPTSVTIEAGQETTAIGTLTDNGITTTAYTPTYTSSNTGVATVSSIGYVDAISAGTANITVSYDVDGTTYSAVCAVTVTPATVVTSYTVSYYVNGSLLETETVAENGHPDFDAPTTDISAYDAHDYTFIGWAPATVAETTTAPTMYTASTASSYTVTGDVTFHAVYTWSEGGSGSGSGSYELVTSTSQLTSGANVVIAASGYDYAISTTQNNNNRGRASITKSGTNITLGSEVCEFTLGAGTTTGTWSFYDATNSGYIYAASSSSNYLRTESSLSANSSWSITVTSAGVATVIAQGSNTRNQLKHNNSSSIFSCYASGQQDIALYVKGSGSGSSGTDYYTTTLAAGDGETATLSVSPSSMSLSTGGYGQIAVTAANGGANAYVTATSSSNSVAQVYALNDGNNTFGVTAGSAGSATITIRYFDSSNTQLASQTVSVTVTAASGTGGTNSDYGRVGSDGNAPTTSGNVNAGTRGVVATSISQKAADYYESKGVTWADLTALAGVNSTSSVTAASGNALKSRLQSLMTLSHTVTYSSLTTYWPSTDKSGGSSQNLYIYSNVTSNSSVSREHVWPKSRGQFYESGAGSDLQHLRPEESTVNSTRGNHTMGYVNGVISGASTKTYGGSTVLWYSGSYSSNNCDGLVEVMDVCKGDVARILLYVYTEYPENTNLFTKTSGGGSGNNASDGNKVIESRDTLLKWCALDPVDTWEMSRNDAVQNIQGNRNVFIDYPELAWMIFNLTPPSTMQTPSGQAAAGNVGTREADTTNYGTSAVNNSAVMSADPAPATRGGATRAIGDVNTSLPVIGAVMVDKQGQISNNDDVVAYLENYGAKNCLIVPAGGAVVFYLNNGADGTEVAIGASALNGTATTLKVYQITAVSESAATGTVLLEQALAASTEMYYKIPGITWTGEKTNVLMVRNEGSAPMLITNLRATGNPNAQISTRAIHAGINLDNLEMVIDADTITAAVKATNAINDGTFNETPVTPTDPTDPVESDIVLRGNSISLNGQIDVNFYVDVPADLLNAGVYATLDGERADFTEGQYGTMVSKKLPAKEMNTKVTLKLYAADGTELTFKNGNAVVTENRYSVQDYLTYVINNPATYGEELVKLCKAMSDYGAYTQAALDFDVENAKSIYLADEIAAVTCGDYGYSYTPNTEHISFLGGSVVTESETAIRIYFSLNGEGFTATVDGEPAAIRTNERGNFVEIANISAKNLGDKHTIVVTNGTETVTIANYSAYSYVQDVLNYSGASASLINAAKALKLYGDLAAEYFKEEN